MPSVLAPSSIAASVRIARVPRSVPILVCGRCLKRQGGGKTVRRALKEAAAAHLARSAGSGRACKPRIVRTACLGPCPKRAIVAASGASLARSELILLSGPVDAAAAVEALLPGDPGRDGP